MNGNLFIVDIEGEKIDRTVINMCVNYLSDLRSKSVFKPQLRIVAKKKITDIDYSIIGHLILMKKEKTDLQISLIFEQNENELGDGLMAKLKQLMAHACLSVGFNPFTITLKGETLTEDEFGKDYLFVLSRKFMPIVYVNEDTYQANFETPIQMYALEKLSVVESQKGDDEERLYQSCREFLFKKKNPSNYLSILAQVSFYKSLQNLKSLRYYLFDQLSEGNRAKINLLGSKDDIQVSNVRNIEKKKKYNETISFVFDELKEKSPVYHLVFYTLTSSEIIESSIKNKNIESVATKILNLWGFTKELVYGINELAKNLQQHSSFKEGIISGYVNSENKLVLKIFDHGEKSVIHTLLDNTIKLCEEAEAPFKEIYEKDRKTLETNFDFSSLFSSDGVQLLEQQTKRATAHLGLQFFYKLIEENHGDFFASTKEKDIKVYPKNFENSQITPVEIGTHYDVRLSIEKDKEYIPYKMKTLNGGGIYDSHSVEELLSYNEIYLAKAYNPSSLEPAKQYVFNIDLSEIESKNSSFEDKLWDDFYSFFLNDHLQLIKKDDNIICIGFYNVSKINASQLFRFLGKVEISFPKNNLIIYGIQTDLLFELLEINKSYLKSNRNLPYWNPDVITLIYSYKKLDTREKNNGGEQDVFYFTDALWGKTRNDFLNINALIQRNNYNSISLYPGFNRDEKDNMLVSNLPANNLFYENITLLPFDLLIKDDTKTTLFEYNAYTLLKNELYLKDENENLNEKIMPIEGIKKQIKNLPGFKLSNSHFRLGSKIHITDYYYAKRFFQSSFYAQRFAFIIAKYMIDKFEEKIVRNSTLIGYGIYSELLVSLIVTILKKYWETQNKKRQTNLNNVFINHNLFDDTESLTLIKGYENINKNIFIIVPIASTFSTSLKIEEKLLREIKSDQHHIIPIHINALVVSDGNMQSKTKLSDLEKKFGWEFVDHNEKCVDVIFYDLNCEKRVQKYFLSLPSQWHSIDSCSKCFPRPEDTCPERKCKDCIFRDDPEVCILLEKPLLMTDKTSVTPALIFDYPKAKKVDEEEFKQKIVLTENALEYGHTSRNSSHFHYYIYDEKFYNDNEALIKEWLYKVKSRLQRSNNLELNENRIKEFLERLKKAVTSTSDDEIAWFHGMKNELGKFFNPEIIESDLNLLKNEIESKQKIDDIAQSVTLKINELWINILEKRIQRDLSINSPQAKDFLVKVLSVIQHPIYYDTDNVLIIAPEHFSNALFVNLVNEILFSNSANILHYDVSKNDFINFQTFYIDTVKKANRIFFVDDTIISGDTFFRSNDFIKHSVQKKHGFDVCIVLINRINFFTQRNINRKLPNDETKRFFSFTNLHLPVLKSNGEECQLCSDHLKLKNLFNESLLNRFKFHYYERIKKLQEKEINHCKAINEHASYSKESKNIRKIEAIHRIFNCSLSKKSLFGIVDFKQWQKQLILNSTSPLAQALMREPSQTEELLPLSADTAVLLKVLALPPFNNYKIIKERIFAWTISLLNDQLEKIKENEYKFTYKEFRDLKFLIRRAGLLNSNYLISIRFLKFIINLYKSGSWNILLDKYRKKIEKLENINGNDASKYKLKIANLNDFSSYLVAQIKELTYQNESRTIILERHIYELTKNEKFEYKKIKQLFRIMQEENGILIKRFWEFAKKEILKKSLDVNSEKYYTLLSKCVKELEGHYQYKILNDFFKESNASAPDENKDFINYIAVQNLVQDTDFPQSNPSFDFNLQKKTNILGDNLQKLFFQDTDSLNRGMFLLVKYRRSPSIENEIDNDKNKKINYLFLAYNKGKASGLIENNWDGTNNYIHDFIKGTKNEQEDYLITIDLIEKKDKVWGSLYTNSDTPIKIDTFDHITNINYLLLLRLSVKNFNDENIDPEQTSQGVLVFYSDTNCFEMSKSRYLLLLKDSISRFIKKHHKNDEFRDWKEAYDDVRKSDLAGHGREMLLELAKDDDRFKQIILNMEHIQIIQKLGAAKLGIDEQTNWGDLFNKFYYVDGDKIINEHYINKLKELAIKIFESHRIENPEELDNINPKIENDLHFPFSESILDIICFEIFINAKKNRWIFFNNENIEGYTKNRIEIEAVIKDEKLFLEIKSTGPLIDYETLKQLKLLGCPKGKGRISGISLIVSLLTDFKMPSGECLGKLEFDREEISRNEKFGKFVVRIILNKMD